MQTGQQGCAVGGIGLIEQHPRVERLGLEHARGAYQMVRQLPQLTMFKMHNGHVP